MEAGLRPQEFFDLEGFAHAALFEGTEHVWEALGRLKRYLDEHLRPGIEGTVMPGAYIGEQVYLAPGSVVEPGAMVKGPAWIGPGTTVRQGAYVREYVVTGERCVIGHTTEVKGSILLDEAQAPHFNYVGDSILGRHVNLGAGTKLSNLKADGTEVLIAIPGRPPVRTGLRKLGAILGDRVSTGCNCVTNPGTLIGPDSVVYANASVRGLYPARCVIKLRQVLEVVERRVP